MEIYHHMSMNYSRRHFVITSTAVGGTLIAGCLEESPDTGGGGDDGTDNGESDCEYIDLSLVDDPPHDPQRPPQPDDIEDEEAWDDHHLGEGIADDSALSFDQVSVGFHDSPVDPTEYDGEAVFSAELISSREEFDELLEPVSDESVARVDEVDFEEEAIVVVVSGFGSSSVGHEWVRVDENCEEIHIHGYYLWPYIQTTDYTYQVSGIVVEKPDAYELERAWVSLTVGEDTRANFHTDEDIQVVGEDDADSDGDTDDGEEADGDGAVDQIQVVSATRESKGDWDNDDRDDIGVVIQFDDEDELRAVIDEHEDVDRFIEGTDFEADAVFYLETTGPNACYRDVDIGDVEIIADDDGYFVRGNAIAVTDADEDEVCNPVVSFPSVLIRVESEVDVRNGEFSITDGWGDEETVLSVSVDECSQE